MLLVVKLFNEQMGKLEDKYNELSNVEKKEFQSRYNTEDLFLKDFNCED